jgi:hypothetical protein
MKRVLLGLLIGCMTLGVASLASAGDNANAGISLHITNPPVKATSCSTNSPDFGGKGGKSIDTKGLPCSQGLTGEFDVWVLVCNGSDSTGVAGLEYGLEYDGALGSGVDVSSWRLCADLEFTSGSYPDAGSGTIVTWDPSTRCQATNAESHGVGGGSKDDPNGNLPVPRSVIAIAGVFRINIWGGDTMEITPRPVSGKLKVADCSAKEDNLTSATVSRKGIASFCSNYNGYNFCAKGALSGELPTTWGKIKSQYN